MRNAAAVEHCLAVGLVACFAVVVVLYGADIVFTFVVLFGGLMGH